MLVVIWLNVTTRLGAIRASVQLDSPGILWPHASVSRIILNWLSFTHLPYKFSPYLLRQTCRCEWVSRKSVWTGSLLYQSSWIIPLWMSQQISTSWNTGRWMWSGCCWHHMWTGYRLYTKCWMHRWIMQMSSRISGERNRLSGYVSSWNFLVIISTCYFDLHPVPSHSS